MAAFSACACKLSWTPARVQPLYGAGRKESSGTGLKCLAKLAKVSEGVEGETGELQASFPIYERWLSITS